MVNSKLIDKNIPRHCVCVSILFAINGISKMRVEKRNKIQRGEIYYQSADGRTDQSRVKRLLKNTSTCAQKLSLLLRSLFFFISLRCATHTHTALPSKVLVFFPRAKACPRGKRGIT